jgi:ABC-type lipoprotein release transport system permease subunit
LKDFDFYNQNTIYLPLKSFDNSLNSNNSRLTYTYYLKFKKLYDNKIIDLIKNDQDLKDFKIRSLEDRNDNISNITDRFYVFINFFNLVIFVLTFFVVILSLETFFKKIKHTL